LLKLSDGEYIAPSKIELALTSHSCVDTVCIYGRSQYSYLVALVVPNQANLRKLAQQVVLLPHHPNLTFSFTDWRHRLQMG
jgi:long-chain acyl-CoA synthetase